MVTKFKKLGRIMIYEKKIVNFPKSTELTHFCSSAYFKPFLLSRIQVKMFQKIGYAL